MTINNNGMHACSDRSALKGGLKGLLFIVILILGLTTVHALDDSKEKAWTLNSEEEVVSAKQGKGSVTEVIDIPIADEQAGARLDTQDQTEFESKLQIDSIEGGHVTGNAVIQEVTESVAGNDDTSNNKSSAAQREKEVQLSHYDISVGAKPIDIPNVSVGPPSILSAELRNSLERQFQEIQTLKETEDAFSEQLGESYLAYGKALMQVGRLEEARKMLVNALHLAKINNGVNGIEQRPILRQLFEMNLALGNAEETDEHLRRIIWLEKKVPDQNDTYSFDMVVRLGNFYLDRYLANPIVSELSIDYLDKSTNYLGYAVNRYGDRPLSEILLPYGELALAHHLKSNIQYEFDRSYYQNERQRNAHSVGNTARQRVGVNAFSRSQRFLKDYLRKAQGERDLENTIHALIGLGDLSLLTGRTGDANRFFDLAWSGAQNLPLTHPIVESFNNPVKLPAFTQSVVRKPKPSLKETALIPLSINVDDDGHVRKVARKALVETTTALTNKARRVAKRVRFRPIIENGKLVPISDYRYEVQVSVRKPKPVAKKDPA